MERTTATGVGDGHEYDTYPPEGARAVVVAIRLDFLPLPFRDRQRQSSSAPRRAAFTASSAKLYDPGLSTQSGYASYPGFNLNADRSRPSAQLSSSAPSVSVATQTVPEVVTSALPMDVSTGASEAKATPTAPTTSSATTSMKSGSYIKLGQFSGRGPVLPF